MLDPNLISGGLSLLSGFFGPKPQYDPMQKFQIGVANDLRDYAKGVPGSDPGEMAADAQLAAQLGQLQGNNRQQFFSQLGGPGRLDQSQMGDMQANMQNQEIGQQMMLRMQQMLANLNKRRQALLQSAEVAHGVGPRQEMGGGQIGQAFGNLAYMYGQKAAMDRYNQQNRQPAVGAMGQSGAMHPGYTPGMQIPQLTPETSPMPQFPAAPPVPPAMVPGMGMPPMRMNDSINQMGQMGVPGIGWRGTPPALPPALAAPGSTLPSLQSRYNQRPRR